MRYLALDYGTKRIGLAVSDPLGITAQPIGYVLRDGKTILALRELIKEKEVTDVVLGLPLALNGQPSQMSQEVEAFGEKLKKKLSLPVHYWKEWLTTSESEKLLVAAHVRRSKRKHVRDAMAAALILQGFLEAQTNL